MEFKDWGTISVHEIRNQSRYLEEVSIDTSLVWVDINADLRVGLYFQKCKFGPEASANYKKTHGCGMTYLFYF